MLGASMSGAYLFLAVRLDHGKVRHLVLDTTRLG
jgi:hypothetical protein